MFTYSVQCAKYSVCAVLFRFKIDNKQINQSPMNKNIIKHVSHFIYIYIYIYIYINHHLKTDEHQHNLKWLLFRNRCKYRLLCLAHKSIFLGKPDYLHNQLKREMPNTRFSE